MNSVGTNPPTQHPVTTMSRAWSIGISDHKSTGSSSQALWTYVGVYLGLSILICLLFVAKFLSILIVSIKASRKLFEDFTNAVFHAPLHWLDTVPTGRLLNRFTADFNVIDESMADGLGFFLNQILQGCNTGCRCPRIAIHRRYRRSSVLSLCVSGKNLLTWNKGRQTN